MEHDSSSSYSSSSASSSSHPSLKNLNKRAEILSRQILRMPVSDNNYDIGVTGISEYERSEQFMQMLKTVESEVSAYDEANMRAMETYFRKVWSKVPFFGKRSKEQLQVKSDEELKKAGVTASNDSRFVSQDMRDQRNINASETRSEVANENIVSSETTKLPFRNTSWETEKWSSAVSTAANTNNVGVGSALAGERFRTTRSRTTSGHLVERTSLCEAVNGSNATSSSNNAATYEGSSSASRLTSLRNRNPLTANRKASVDNKPAEFRTSWLFKQRHPNWVPLMQRWWIPWLCVGSIALIWTPDVWKLRVLYLCDYKYAQLRQSIHIAYWRLTMKPDDFAELMASIEAERPSTVNGTACPFE